MEIIINTDKFSFSIVDGRVKSDILLDKPDVKRAINILEE